MYLTNTSLKSGVDTSVLITIEKHKASIAVDAAISREHKYYNIPWGINRIVSNIEKSGYSKEDVHSIMCYGQQGGKMECELINVQLSTLFYQIQQYIAPFLSNSHKTRIKITGCLFSDIKNCFHSCLKDYDSKMLVNVLPPIAC